MADNEKERELPEEGVDLKEQKSVEQMEGSSLAADQESVTKIDSLDKNKSDSSEVSDDSSNENNNRKVKKDETSQDNAVPKKTEITEESNEIQPSSEVSEDENVSPPESIPIQEQSAEKGMPIPKSDESTDKNESNAKGDPDISLQDVVETDPDALPVNTADVRDVDNAVVTTEDSTEISATDNESDIVKEDAIKATSEIETDAEKEVPAEAAGEIKPDTEEEVPADVAGEIKPDTKEEVAADVADEIKPDAKKEVAAEVADEIKPDAKEEVAADVAGEIKPDTKEEVAADVADEIKPDAKEEVSGDVADEIKPDSEGEVADEIKPDAEKEVPAEAAGEIKPEAVSGEGEEKENEVLESDTGGVAESKDSADLDKEKINTEGKSETEPTGPEEYEELDYSLLAKDALIHEFEKILKIEDLKLAEKKIRELRPFFDEIVAAEQKTALQKFLNEGGAEIDFQYIGDALDTRFYHLNDRYKARRNAYYAELEKNKESNLQKKQEILEKLRAIVDGEETNASISALKNIQNEWRSVGPVPSSNAKSMWATYHILIDRFYDNRSIYFELKELDRKKNLEAKLELCEKAEQLLEYTVIRDAVKELNELHEEFKHIGPVPKEMQEVVWQRFKSASDSIYNRRKDYVNSLKKELHENLELKKHLVEEVAKFENFDSDKISDWNEKTKEILNVQKKWEEIGGLPREHAKEINKLFWSSFKTFFNNKNRFFKKLESQRDENMLKKEELVKRAEALKESNEWEVTAEKLKELQQEWRDIGPIPEKNRNEIYKRFKNACDTFFNRRRDHSKEVESEYKVNLRKKDEICVEIEKMAQDGEKDIDHFKELQIQFNSIGFVPRNTIKKIQKRYDKATELFLNSFDLSDSEKSELRFAAEVDKLKSSPNSDRRIQKKEVEIRRLIGKFENDIALWKNNIEFFAKSKTADKVREEFNDKIEKASTKLKELREELKVLNKI